MFLLPDYIYHCNSVFFEKLDYHFTHLTWCTRLNNSISFVLLALIKQPNYRQWVQDTASSLHPVDVVIKWNALIGICHCILSIWPSFGVCSWLFNLADECNTFAHKIPCLNASAICNYSACSFSTRCDWVFVLSFVVTIHHINIAWVEDCTFNFDENLARLWLRHLHSISWVIYFALGFVYHWLHRGSFRHYVFYFLMWIKDIYILRIH